MKTNFAVVVMLASIFLSVALVAHSATAKKTCWACRIMTVITYRCDAQNPDPYKCGKLGKECNEASDCKS